MARSRRTTLYDDSYDEDDNIDQDRKFSGECLGDKSAVEAANPSTELENRCEPALLRLILYPFAHVWKGSVVPSLASGMIEIL